MDPVLKTSLTKAAVGDWLKTEGHFSLVAWRLPQLLEYLLWVHKNSTEPKQARRTHFGKLWNLSRSPVAGFIMADPLAHIADF